MGINDYIKIGHRIRDIRTKKGVTLTEMASKLKIPKSTLANYEADRREMPWTVIYDAIDYLGVSIEEVLGSEIPTIFHQAHFIKISQLSLSGILKVDDLIHIFHEVIDSQDEKRNSRVGELEDILKNSNIYEFEDALRSIEKTDSFILKVEDELIKLENIFDDIFTICEDVIEDTASPVSKEVYLDEDWTEEEEKQIADYKEFIKSKRKKETK